MPKYEVRRLAFHEVVCDEAQVLHHAIVEVCGYHVLNSYTFTGEPAMTEWIGGKAFIRNGKLEY